MPEAVSTTQRGNTVIVWFYTYDEDENLADLDQPASLEVWKSGLRVLGPVPMVHWGIGVYRYELDTSVMPAGQYKIVCKGILQGKNVVQDTPLTVTEPWLI